MSNVILYIATSLDGYIARMDHDISWLSNVEVKDEDYGYQQFFNDVSAVIMGNSSFQVIKDFGDWPYTNKQCFVASHSPDIVPNDNVTFITDPAATIKQLKASDEGNIWLLGGANLADSLLRLDLVDELILSTIPILLGNGIRLFNAPLPELGVTLLSSQSYPSGLIQTHYKIIKKQQK
ncbi:MULTISPECIES: dihydrofolate reductase family protein [unclassified Moritella]|uniref:dihydrofolate reductase family protein n=1 Tax=unclassified Moritella TaxID=2637987 RepID=UPI001BA78139|nr:MULTISPECIES: dihydrofolate reductase family protein [unclassified Moritella]QUM86845.1 dihydrofolate reductase [Moritella sp. 28]QUM91070.1 dihydrofolate reductase [Moritella sp. 36]